MLANDEQLDQNFHHLSTIMDKEIVLKAQGKKTVLYFFAPWCQVCNLSIDNLQAIYQKNPNIEVIAVALDFVDIEQVKQFTKNHQLTFPVALGNETIKADFKVKGYPSYYVLNEQNTVVGRSLGYSSEIGLYLRSL
jgi:thiol-disulfide isomerase/thioredoxin